MSVKQSTITHFVLNRLTKMESFPNLIASDLMFCISDYTEEDIFQLHRMVNYYTVIWNRSNQGFIIGVIARKKQTAIDLRAIKRRLPRAHIEPLRSSFADAVNYINSV